MHIKNTLIVVAGLIFLLFATVVYAETLDVVSMKSSHIGELEYLSELEDFARETKSNIAYTKLQLLRNKYDIDTSNLTYNQRFQPNSYSLLDAIYGPLGSFFIENNLNSELEILTGQRAIDESLQLGSINTRDIGGVSQESAIPVGDIEKLSVKSHPWEKMLEGKTVSHKPGIMRMVPKDNFVIYFDDVTSIDRMQDMLQEVAAPGDMFYDVSGLLDIQSKIVKRLGVSNIEKLKKLASSMVFVSEDLSFIPATNYAIIIDAKIGSFKSIASLLDDTNTIHGERTYNDGDEAKEYYIISSSQKLYDELASVSLEESMYSAKDFEYAWAELDSRRDGMVYFSEDFILKLVSPEYRISAGRRNVALGKLETLQYIVFAYTNITGKIPTTLKQIADEGYIEYKSIESPELYSIDSTGVIKNKYWGSLYSIIPISEVAITTVNEAEKARYDSFRDGYESYWREFFDPIGIAFTASDNLYLHTIILPLIDESTYNSIKSAVGNTSGTFDGLEHPIYSSPAQFLMHYNFDNILLELYDSFSGNMQRTELTIVQSNMNNMRSRAELYYDENSNSYGKTTSCKEGLFAENKWARNGEGPLDNVISSEIVENVECHSDGASYYIKAYFLDNESMYCVDSNGNAILTEKALGSICEGERLGSNDVSKKIDEILKRDTGEPTLEERKKEVNEFLNEQLDEIGFPKDFNFFGILGNELQFHIGSGIPFELDNISDVDAVFAIKLEDQQRADEFINTVYSIIAEEFGNEMSFGIFRISSKQPLKNEYNGKEYYTIPTGFVNLYYAYVDDYILFTISQASMNTVLDGTSENDPVMTDIQDRSIEYLGREHNMILLADIQPFEKYKEDILNLAMEPSYELARQSQKIQGHLTDVRYIRKNDMDDAMLISATTKLFGVLIEVIDDEIRIGDYSFSEVDFGRTGSYYSGNNSSNDSDTMVPFSDILLEKDRIDMLTNLNALKGFSIATNFTEHGLDVKIAIDNPLISKRDDRFGISTNETSSDSSMPSAYLLIIFGVVGVLVVVGTGIAMYARKNRVIVSLSDETIQTHPAEDIVIQQTVSDDTQSIVNPELLTYVKQAREINIADTLIKENLLKSGWSAEEIQSALIR